MMIVALIKSAVLNNGHSHQMDLILFVVAFSAKRGLREENPVKQEKNKSFNRPK